MSNNDARWRRGSSRRARGPASASGRCRSSTSTARACAARSPTSSNTGPRAGGAITAGLFIREFAGDTPWAHLDIAGVAFTDKELPYAAKGGVGFGARTLIEYVLAAAGRG